MPNAFDQFDQLQAPAVNSFDQFDAPARPEPGQISAFGYTPSLIGMAKGLFNTARSAVNAPADALAGQMSPDDMTNRALDFATLASPASAALRAGEIIPGSLTRGFAPSAQELKKTAAAGYDAARASTASVPGADVASQARQLQQTLQDDNGIIAKTAPKTFAILDELANPPAGSLGTYAGLEAARRGLGAIRGEAGTDGLAAQKAIHGLDPFIDSIAPEAADARANYAAAQRSNDLTGTLDRANTGVGERAEARAAASNSGRNLDNAIRQRIASFLQNPENVAGYSQAEIDALNSLVRGGPAQNAARFVGNMLGGGGGMGHTMTGAIGGAGAAHFGGGGLLETALGAAVPPMVGYGAKSLENWLAQRSLNNVDQTVRMNSPLARTLQSGGGLLAPAMDRNTAIMRALLPGLLAPQQPQNPNAQMGLLQGYI